jgi:hypothetical protein
MTLEVANGWPPNATASALLADLVGVARRLSDDELRALLTIAVRTWVGQAKTTASRMK